MSNIRVSNIEAKADASSPTIDEKLKITNSQGRVLVQVDGKTSGITTIGINTTGNTFTVSGNNVTFAGIVTATGGFSGNVSATGISTFSNIRITGGTISGVSTAGITTVYIGAINDGPISGARNRIINGDMRIDQRNAGASVTRATTDVGLYTLDRWLNSKNNNSKAYTIQRSGNAPVGFTSSLLFTVTSTDGTTGSTQYNDIRQPIEGYNVADLMWGTANAKPVTLSFWVRSSVTGTYAVCLVIQGAGNYPATYTINSANTWEYKAITIPGATSGTWPIDNSRGLDINFDMGIGSSYSTSTNTWTYGQNVFGGSGVTKLTETNGATFYLTGVQLEAGTVATPFERRSYGQELALCERYYQIKDFNGGAVNIYQSSVGAYFTIQLYPIMRDVPSVITYDTSMANSGNVFTNGVAVPVTYATNATATSSSISARTVRSSGTWGASDSCGHTYIRIRAASEL